VLSIGIKTVFKDLFRMKKKKKLNIWLYKIQGEGGEWGGSFSFSAGCCTV